MGEMKTMPVRVKEGDAQTPIVVEAEAERRIRLRAEASADAEANPRDFAPNGGRFMVGGRLVDSNGNPVPEASDAMQSATER